MVVEKDAGSSDKLDKKACRKRAAESTGGQSIHTRIKHQLALLASGSRASELPHASDLIMVRVGLTSPTSDGY